MSRYKNMKQLHSNSTENDTWCLIYVWSQAAFKAHNQHIPFTTVINILQSNRDYIWRYSGLQWILDLEKVRDEISDAV